jgi:hypothetical protein
MTRILRTTVSVTTREDVPCLHFETDSQTHLIPMSPHTALLLALDLQQAALNALFPEETQAAGPSLFDQGEESA